MESPREFHPPLPFSAPSFCRAGVEAPRSPIDRATASAAAAALLRRALMVVRAAARADERRGPRPPRRAQARLGRGAWARASARLALAPSVPQGPPCRRRPGARVRRERERAAGAPHARAGALALAVPVAARARVEPESKTSTFEFKVLVACRAPLETNCDVLFVFEWKHHRAARAPSAPVQLKHSRGARRNRTADPELVRTNLSPITGSILCLSAANPVYTLY